MKCEISWLTMHKVLTYFGLKLCITVNSSPVYWRIQQDIKLQWLHSFGEINIDDWPILKTRIRSRITSPILRMHKMHRINKPLERIFSEKTLYLLLSLIYVFIIQLFICRVNFSNNVYVIYFLMSGYLNSTHYQ